MDFASSFVLLTKMEKKIKEKIRKEERQVTRSSRPKSVAESVGIKDTDFEKENTEGDIETSGKEKVIRCIKTLILFIFIILVVYSMLAFIIVKVSKNSNGRHIMLPFDSHACYFCCSKTKQKRRLRLVSEARMRRGVGRRASCSGMVYVMK